MSICRYLFLLAGFTPSLLFADRLIIDPQHTRANFKVDVAGFATIEGTVPHIEGQFALSPENRLTRIKITLPIKDISTGSMLIDPILLSGEMLDGTRYPVANFEGEESRQENQSPRSIDGKLTLKGRSAPVHWTLNAFDCPSAAMKCEGVAETTLQRDTFDIGGFMGLVDQSIHVTVYVKAEREPD